MTVACNRRRGSSCCGDNDDDDDDATDDDKSRIIRMRATRGNNEMEDEKKDDDDNDNDKRKQQEEEEEAHLHNDSPPPPPSGEEALLLVNTLARFLQSVAVADDDDDEEENDDDTEEEEEDDDSQQESEAATALLQKKRGSDDDHITCDVNDAPLPQEEKADEEEAPPLLPEEKDDDDNKNSNNNHHHDKDGSFCFSRSTTGLPSTLTSSSPTSQRLQFATRVDRNSALGSVNAEQRQQQQGNREIKEPMPTLFSLLENLSWNRYCHWAGRNAAALHLMEVALERILWWIPPTTSQRGGSSSQRWCWRQVLWGLLHLHRLALELSSSALQQHQSQSCGGGGDEGTTLRLPELDVTSRRCRIALTIIQSLWPMLVSSLSSSQEEEEEANGQHHHDNIDGTTTTTIRRGGRSTAVGVALTIERLRFGLRAVLLWRYWRGLGRLREKQQQTSHRNQESSRTAVPGLLQVGGLWPTPTAPTVQQEWARQARACYVGRRTGRRVVVRSPSPSNANYSSSSSSLSSRVRIPGNDEPKSLLSSVLPRWRVYAGEALHLVRPLFWAQAQWDATLLSDAGEHEALVEQKRRSFLFKAWWICVALDVLSLASLRRSQEEKLPQNNATSGNGGEGAPPSAVAAARQEWQRRFHRLWLYLLRAPVWETYTAPLVLGTTPHNSWWRSYLQEWLWYWRVYRAEEG